jgi:hypothetical protein
MGDAEGVGDAAGELWKRWPSRSRVTLIDE